MMLTRIVFLPLPPRFTRDKFPLAPAETGQFIPQKNSRVRFNR
jgi:hypothetical protein